MKVTNENPIAFETVHYPLNTDLYSPFRTRKVIMYVKLGALNLPEAVKKRFIALTEYPETQVKVIKPRYNAGLDLLRLSSRSQRTLVPPFFLLQNSYELLSNLCREAIAQPWSDSSVSSSTKHGKPISISFPRPSLLSLPHCLRTNAYKSKSPWSPPRRLMYEDLLLTTT